MTKILDIKEEVKVSYCVPLWVRDEQVKLSTERIKGRIEAAPANVKREDPIAIVCFGPSLNQTWEEVKKFKYIITGSGAHKFLVERGVIPTWHVEVDPRKHKAELIGPPHPDVTYLISSACHQKVFDHLETSLGREVFEKNVKLWHIFSNEEDCLRLLPKDEWAITGGSNVGLRQMTIARFFGFTEMHIFGMDGSEGPSGKHAAAHPMQPQDHVLVEYPEKSGVMYKTTPSMFQCAKQTFHEINQLKDCTVKFYGEGLVQAIAKDFKQEPVKGDVFIAFAKPALISDEYRELNAKLHLENVAYGVGGGKHADTVVKLAEKLKTNSILDYGCGKGYLAKAIKFPIWEYDPAIPGKDEAPRPADIVVCADVLEHIEPDKLKYVLDDLQRCTLKLGYFIVHTGPSSKSLADGRNAHLIQKPKDWWSEQIGRFFQIGKIFESGPLLYYLVGPKPYKVHKNATVA